MLNSYNFLNDFNLKDNIKLLADNFNFINFLDIFFVFLFLFSLLYFFKKINLHRIVLNFSFLFILIYFLSLWFKFSTVMILIKFLLGFLLIFFIIIFQKELRKLVHFLDIKGVKINELIKQKQDKNFDNKFLNYLVEAVFSLAKRKEGALIVLKRKDTLNFLESGVEIYAQLSAPLILSIFNKNSPLHDGALILNKEIIEKASVVLPLSEDIRNKDLKKFGTRHRAALGLTERSDAIVIVVSEEKGTVSLCEQNKFLYIQDEKELLTKLKFYFQKEKVRDLFNFFKKKLIFLKSNFLLILLTLVISIIFWSVNTIANFNFVYQDFKVPIVFNKIPNNAIIEKLTDNFIDLTFLASEKDFKFLNKDDIKVVIDFSSLNLENKTQYVKIEIKPEIIKYPSNLKLIKYNPQKVEFKLVFEELNS